LEELDCSENKLTFLNIANCKNLKEIYCFVNQLEELDCSQLSELEKLFCRDNQLTNLMLPNSAKLTFLAINNNDLFEQDLSMFSKLTDLVLLFIGNRSEEKINQGIYNRFVGSLQLLQNLTKLKILEIENTDLESDLEYLPESITEIHFFNINKNIFKELEKILKKNGFLFVTNIIKNLSS